MRRYLKKINVILKSCFQKKFVWNYAGPKELDSIIKVNLLEQEYPERIEYIWNTHHLMKMNMISDVIITEKFGILNNRLKKYPMFVIPIHKKFGYGTF